MSLSSMELLAEKARILSKPPSENTQLENEEKFKLSFAFQNLDDLDEKMIPKNSAQILILDLTENNFNGSNDLRFLFEFPNLKTLILDKNKIQSNFIIPEMPNLTTLWLNHNSIENLSIFIENLCHSCPNLTYLSMLNNKAAPSYFNGGSLVEYNDYRLYVISKLLKLKMLDDKEITEQDRHQSQAIYGTGRLVRYNERRNSQLAKPKRKSTKKTPEKIQEIEASDNVNSSLPTTTNVVANEVVQITDEKKVSSTKEVKKRTSKILEKTIQTELSAEISESQKNFEEKNEIGFEKKAQTSENVDDLLNLLPQLPDEIDLPETFEAISQNNCDLDENMSYSLPSLSNSIELGLIDSLPLVMDFPTNEPPLPQTISFDLDEF